MSHRDKILDATMRVYADCGFKGATTRQIAQEAGVNEVTLFRQFGSKAALIGEAIRRHAEATFTAVLPDEPVDPEAELSVWCALHLTHLRESRPLIRQFLSELHQYPEMLSCAQAGPAFSDLGLGTYLGRLREQGLTDADIDLKAAVQMLRGALFNDAMNRDMAPERFPQPESVAAAMYARLFLRSVGCCRPDSAASQPAPALPFSDVQP